MSLFDIVLLVVLGGFAMFGFWFGLLHTLGSLVGTVLGTYLASRWYDNMASWVTHITGWEGNWTNVVMFVIAFIVINRLVGLLFWFGDRFFSVFTRLPFLASLNRLLGFILGLFEGLITLGIIFFFIDKFPVGSVFMGWVESSVVVPYTLNTAQVLLPLIPQAVKELKSAVEYIGNITLR
jgi:uncharacterized membrane protein required for colicin V production